MNKIENVISSLYKIPLDEPLGDAMHAKHVYFELVVVEIKTEDGNIGYGYTYTGGVGGIIICNMIELYLKPILLGQDSACIEKLWVEMYKLLHYVGRGGIDSFAIAAVDIALWDIKCRIAKMPLWKMIGGGKGFARAYAGGIDLDFTKEKLLQNIKLYMSQGHNAFKIKLGKDSLDEDINRVKAVRELIGNEATFMVDANYKWTSENAIRACRELEKYNVLWLEEPVSPDDIEGYKKVASKSSIALACGENLHTIFEFENMFKYGHIDYPQPDASNLGGITGWLKVAVMCQAKNLPVSTHGMQELHVNLLSGVSNSGWLEIHSFPIDRYTMNPLKIDDGKVFPSNDFGTGVIFNFDVLNSYLFSI